MESESTSVARPSATDAATLLSAVDQAREAMAERLITPWWYHPVYALLTGLLVASMGLPHGWAIPAVITSALGLAALMGAYRDLTGLGTVTGGGRRVGMWIGLIVIAAAAAMFVIVMADRPAVTVIATLTFMPVAAVAGRQVDDALRDSLRRGRGGSR